MLNQDSIGKNFHQMVSQRKRIDGQGQQMVASVSTPNMNCQEKKAEKPKNVLKINIQNLKAFQQHGYQTANEQKTPMAKLVLKPQKSHADIQAT